MSGGLDDQTQQDAGPEANLDTQYAFALAYPTPGTFYSTGGSPPFTPDAKTLSDSNEPYDDVRGISSTAPPFLFGGCTDTHPLGVCLLSG
jgi:hypothetical protein